MASRSLPSTSTKDKAKGKTIKLAILDDYANIAPAYFQRLASSIKNTDLDLEIHSFPTTLNARLPNEHDALIARLQPFSIISSMRERTQFPRSVLSRLPNLKLLLTTGAKNAAIDVGACKELGIRLVGTRAKSGAVPGYDSTNEQTWALILGLVRNVVVGDTRLKTTRDGWQTDETDIDTVADDTDETATDADIDTDTTADAATATATADTNPGNHSNFNPALVSSLAGKTLGLLGLGRLGTQAAVTGHLGFGMRVLAWSSNLTQAQADAAATGRGLPAGTFEVAGSKAELFRRADVLSIHYVLSERSRGIVAKSELSVMKPTAVLVNTSRGPLVHEPDLLEALETGAIAAVGLDVFDTEPLPPDSPWRRPRFWGRGGRSRVLLSPHLGYAEDETMHAWYEQQVAAVRLWLSGAEITAGVVIV
ncbi:glycerate dehydrogenase [Capronia epimyces CBS 606.96]|uniref:Glycerate dehydrogenase n=1 Tax=Capronia epimyces CBS 606.96 TaxID=1182542 RepID=W9YTM1_9EURO|nr:glycerate dehydrogenase [Capronia epimyces CBS 606.96]EXJ92606.1 glycerate dehydrogenase [Capronia epimyces CBS 606.96]